MTMLFKSVCVFAAFVAGVRSAPLKSMLGSRQAPNGVPDFVMTYAPKVWLHKDELYYPTDVNVFVQNSIPRVNFNEVSAPKPLALNDIKNLGSDVYLTSKDEITANPAAQWIKGTKPDGNGKTNGAVTSVVIVNDKGDGVVDAFYMYFYAYNYGGDILGIKIPFIGKLNFGNHVGDWEHNMIRFKNGVPEHVWFSQHANGQAFKYDVVEKEGLRPIAYSSKGSHANYGKSGKHDHLIPNLNLPGGVLEDDTNKGTLWDPVQSAYFYKFDGANTQFTPYDDKTPVDWMYFRGRWGDQEYPTSDKRQLKVFGQARFSSGPTGPIDKQLNRKDICPDNGLECIKWPILISKRVSEEEQLRKTMKQ